MSAELNAQGGTEKRERSTIGFPYGDLDSGVNVARTLYERGGGHCQMDQLAAWMNYSSVDNGAFRLQLNTARIFGLSSQSRRNIELTQLGHRIVDGEQEAEARVDAFLYVPLYRKVHEHFLGRGLPPDAGLESVFADFGVARKQTSKARQAFQRSAQQAGFFNEGDDRLVRPSIEASYGEGEVANKQAISDTADNDSVMGDGSPKIRSLHPLIRGLVETLPDPGKEWSDMEQKAWLDAAKANFALIYKPQRLALPFRESDSVGQESDQDN